MLPTGKPVNCYSSHYDHQCPTCQTPYEDRSYFLCCPLRQQWRHEAWSSIKKFIAKNPTLPDLSEPLLFIVKDWNFDSEIDTDAYFFDMKTLLSWQFKIGWSQIFLGRFSTEWIKLHDSYLQFHSLKSLPGVIWFSQVIIILWLQLHNNWKLRCDHRHGSDSDSKEFALIKRLQQAIRLLYDVKHQVLPADMDKFYNSVDDHFSHQKTSRELQQWLLTWKPVILSSVTKAKQMGINSLMGIRRFFSSSSPP
jgi:hypothetical protein